MKSVMTAGVLALALGACSAGDREASQAQLVERGDYLVNAVAGCNDCHTPMGPNGPDMAQSLQGATLGFAPLMDMPWGPVAPPIAGGPANYTNEQFVALLQTGTRPDGSRPLPPMPQYRLSEEDARAIAAYVESLPAAQ